MRTLSHTQRLTHLGDTVHFPATNAREVRHAEVLGEALCYAYSQIMSGVGELHQRALTLDQGHARELLLVAREFLLDGLQEAVNVSLGVYNTCICGAHDTHGDAIRRPNTRAAMEPAQSVPGAELVP